MKPKKWKCCGKWKRVNFCEVCGAKSPDRTPHDEVYEILAHMEHIASSNNTTSIRCREQAESAKALLEAGRNPREIITACDFVWYAGDKANAGVVQQRIREASKKAASCLKVSLR